MKTLIYLVLAVSPALSFAGACDDPEILKISAGLTLQSGLCAQKINGSLLGAGSIHLPPPVPYKQNRIEPRNEARNDTHIEAQDGVLCKTCAANILRKSTLQPIPLPIPVQQNSFGPVSVHTITYYNLPGNITASGKPFIASAMRAAMPARNSQAIKAGAWYRVFNAEGKFVDVCVNDHLPSRTKGLDLTPGAFRVLAPLGTGQLEARMQKIAEPPPGVPKKLACDSRYASWHPEMGGGPQVAATRARN